MRLLDAQWSRSVVERNGKVVQGGETLRCRSGLAGVREESRDVLVEAMSFLEILKIRSQYQDYRFGKSADKPVPAVVLRATAYICLTGPCPAR